MQVLGGGGGWWTLGKRRRDAFVFMTEVPLTDIFFYVCNVTLKKKCNNFEMVTKNVEKKSKKSADLYFFVLLYNAV